MLKLLTALTLCFADPTTRPAVETEDYITAVEPAIAPTSWQLRFRFQDPKRISVLVPGKSEPVLYWYVLYTVENPGKSEVQFFPQFELVTDTLKVVSSEVKVSPEAFKAIQQRVNNPLMLAPERIVGVLQRGTDRKKHGVAIFRDFDPKARSFTVYVSGLSGEMKRVKNPGFDKEAKESPENSRYMVLRKTLAIPYKFAGSETTRSRSVPERVADGLDWVMR